MSRRRTPSVYAISYVCVCVVAALLHWLLCECNCARWRHTQIWNKIKFGAKKFAQIWIKHKIWFNFSRFCLYGDHVDTVSCQRKKVIVSITTYLNMLYSLNTSDTGQRLVIQYKSNIITKTGNYTNIFTRTGAQDRLALRKDIYLVNQSSSSIGWHLHFVTRVRHSWSWS